MKTRIHKLILLSCFLMVLPVSSYSQSLTAITESDVQAMMDSMDKAARKGNVAGMIAPFASDIKVKMTIVNPRTNKEVEATINKEQYAFNARQVLRRRISYVFERKNTRIKIYDAQTATVTSDLYETLKLKQGTIIGASSEVLYLSLRDGKIVITASESRPRLH